MIVDPERHETAEIDATVRQLRARANQLRAEADLLAHAAALLAYKASSGEPPEPRYVQASDLDTTDGWG
ncbi:hypothetical protein [Amycolatopsis cihanbeyliensis]|nr:hypothetical protein [Amycolatopsis cihanbeyliensis]